MIEAALGDGAQLRACHNLQPRAPRGPGNRRGHFQRAAAARIGAVPAGEWRRVDGHRLRRACVAIRPQARLRTWCSCRIRRNMRAAISCSSTVCCQKARERDRRIRASAFTGRSCFAGCAARKVSAAAVAAPGDRPARAQRRTARRPLVRHRHRRAARRARRAVVARRRKVSQGERNEKDSRSGRRAGARCWSSRRGASASSPRSASTAGSTSSSRAAPYLKVVERKWTARLVQVRTGSHVRSVRSVDATRMNRRR